MNFQELLSQLPDCPGSTRFPIKSAYSGFRYIGEGLSEFIGPDLAPSSAVNQTQNPKIMIISAAGAVGKSTLAREIANRKHAPIWSLDQASAVGDNSMTGQLTTAFGFQVASRANRGFEVGSLFIIVDALDEARVKANEAGFEAFIKNIAEISQTASGTAFVILGRTQTAEWTWYILAENGIEAALLTIQPFTREQAEEYIEARIKHVYPVAAKRIRGHKQPFIEARNMILDQLERAVGGAVGGNDKDTREFLGYAPVLETVAVLLAKESNYQDFIKDMSAMGETLKNRPLAVLEHVVIRLLEREQKEKLQHNIKPALEKVAADAKWNDWDNLYSLDEQRTRLFNQILGLNLDVGLRMPGSVQALYEEQLKIWLPEHPFLQEGNKPANKVFESYLYAIAMREYLTQLSKTVEEKVAANKPLRMLADFYILLGEQRGKEVVAKRQIGLLYDSLLASETDSLRIRLSIDSGDPDDEDEEATVGEGEFKLVYAAPDTAGDEQIETRSFKIVEDEGSIYFRRQLKEAEIVTRGTVTLGGDVDDFEIGPSVHIRCGKLEIKSNGLVVRPAPPKSSDPVGVVLDASNCESIVSRKPLVRSTLSVSWPGAEAYPWSDFVVESQDNVIDTEQMHKVFRRFRRIVTSLRSHSRGGLARFKDKVEHRRVLKNELGRALLDTLLSDGIIILRDNFYHWMPDKADAILKLSYNDLRYRRVSPELKAYFKQFIENNQGLF
jgi:hypothetical protein